VRRQDGEQRRVGERHEDESGDDARMGEHAKNATGSKPASKEGSLHLIANVVRRCIRNWPDDVDANAN